MNRKLIPLLIALTASSLLGQQRPNIILIMTDDQGYGDVGYNGHPHLKTPHIDHLANNGLKLTRFYAQSAVCSPTRGSALTGKHPHRLGIPYANTGRLKESEKTIAEIALEKGYRTGHFGKWHLGTLSKTIKDANRGKKDSKHHSPPWKNGFQVCYSTESKVPTWDPMVIPEGQKDKRYWNPAAKNQETKFFGTHYWTQDGKPVHPDSETLKGCDSRIIMDQALKFIDTSASSQKPFLTVIWFHAPHWPVVAGPEYQKRYPGRSDFEKNYWGCISAIDDQVGRLTEKLKANQLLENTLILYASDNGPEGSPNPKAKNHGIGSAKNLTGRKRSLKEGGIRVPGFIHWPAKIKSPRTSGFIATTSDYLPTITEILQQENPEPLDGISLLPLINGKAETRNQPLGFAIKKQIAWMDGDYKVYSQNGKTWQLHNITRDPTEKINLAEKLPEKLNTLKQAALNWKSSL